MATARNLLIIYGDLTAELKTVLQFYRKVTKEDGHVGGNLAVLQSAAARLAARAGEMIDASAPPSTAAPTAVADREEVSRVVRGILADDQPGSSKPGRAPKATVRAPEPPVKTADTRVTNADLARNALAEGPKTQEEVLTYIQKLRPAVNQSQVYQILWTLQKQNEAGKGSDGKWKRTGGGK